jgi:hypothetical protein
VGVVAKKTENILYRVCVKIMRILLHILQKYFEKYSKFLTYINSNCQVNTLNTIQLLASRPGNSQDRRVGVTEGAKRSKARWF